MLGYCGAHQAEASAVTHNFATATGKLVELEEQLSELSDTEQGVAAALHASLARSEGEVASAQSEVADLKAEIQKLTSQLEHANGQLAAKQAELEGSSSKVSEIWGGGLANLCNQFFSIEVASLQTRNASTVVTT